MSPARLMEAEALLCQQASRGECGETVETQQDSLHIRRDHRISRNTRKASQAGPSMDDGEFQH